MKHPPALSQGGFTLVEMIIATAVSSILLAGISVLVFTNFSASTIAAQRLQASGQLQNFQVAFYRDAALDNTATNRSPIIAAAPCDVVLAGRRRDAGGTTNTSYSVEYKLSGSDIRRTVAATTSTVARNVKLFTCALQSDGTFQVVISAQDTTGSYTQSQTFRFYPRGNA
ncbi:MAG: type II secretion system protein J [Candidatus Dormibacteria bacterium]